MVSAITTLISLLPDIIALVKKLWAWIEKENTLAAKRALLNKFTAAVEAARDTGNTSALEAIFRSGNLK